MKNALNMVTVAQFFFKKIPNLPFLVGNLKNGGLGNFVLKIELWELYLEHISDAPCIQLLEYQVISGRQIQPNKNCINSK